MHQTNTKTINSRQNSSKIIKWDKQNSYEKSVHSFLFINTNIYFLSINIVPAIVKLLGI